MPIKSQSRYIQRKRKKTKTTGPWGLTRDPDPGISKVPNKRTKSMKKPLRKPPKERRT